VIASPKLPPGPRSLLPGAFLGVMQRDPIPFLRRLAREYGDAARFRVGRQQLIFFNHPELVRETLVAQHAFFHKSPMLKRAKPIFGEGLLTSEDELHRRERRLAQPAFHRVRIERYGEVMIQRTQKAMEGWRDGQIIDAHREMMRLTLSIVAKTLFDAELERDAAEIGAALTDLVDDFPRLMNPLTAWLRRLRLPWSRRYERAVARLDRVIYALIDERRRSGVDRGDLLSMLMLALDHEGDGGGMSDRQLRDETMTLFLAGHETTANALAWTLLLLAQHPAVTAELHREIDSLNRTPQPSDYARLPFTERVLAESMRRYPPAWGVSRIATQDVTIGDWSVPRGYVVVMAQAVMHRDARWWPDPERFDPDRFLPEAKAARPRMAYFPFGAGPRTCIGEGFAWMEGVLILATLAQRWRLELAGPPPQPHASITLRPRGGIAMRLVRR